MFIVKLKIN